METLSQDEQEQMAQVPQGAIFRHYKGKEYKILHIARSSEDTALTVVYQSLYQCATFGDQVIWTRPLKEFLETIEIEGKSLPRFALIEQPTHA